METDTEPVFKLPPEEIFLKPPTNLPPTSRTTDHGPPTNLQPSECTNYLPSDHRPVKNLTARKNLHLYLT